METLDFYKNFSQRLDFLEANTYTRMFIKNENQLAKCDENFNDLTQQFFSNVVSNDSELIKLKKNQ